MFYMFIYCYVYVHMYVCVYEYTYAFIKTHNIMLREIIQTQKYKYHMISLI